MRATQFHERSARKTTTQCGVQLYDSARLEFHGCPVLKPFSPAADCTGFESFMLRGNGDHGFSFRFLFALRIRSSSGGGELSSREVNPVAGPLPRDPDTLQKM